MKDWIKRNWIGIALDSMWLAVFGYAAFFMLTAHAQAPARLQTFIFTTPSAISPKQSIRVHGKDRMDALANMGFTIWTEQEWKDCKPCQKAEHGGEEGKK